MYVMRTKKMQEMHIKKILYQVVEMAQVHRPMVAEEMVVALVMTKK